VHPDNRARIGNWQWRMAHLYKIRTKKVGEKVCFKPKPAQTSPRAALCGVAATLCPWADLFLAFQAVKTMRANAIYVLQTISNLRFAGT